ncbi:MAG: 1-deoxy-D-xylulose-5-phosphate synthase [Syntrophomonadaceae bacterium]|jgi:1-deoxy-D-xylulose-5-phosphate synthase
MYKILDQINSPQDVKKLSISQMNQLADDIRQILIKSVAQCGGHLAANLGVVELTIALHYVFDSPRDKIIWDVGHQSYVHKILTGRKDKMLSLRQYRGISGFPRSEESVHDAFNTGHSSTSISVALGMALARDLQQAKYSVVSVIGDGALTGGMAFEALNHAGNEDRDLIVILNDNEMSISRNVGALSSYLNRLRTAPRYSQKKEEIESALNRIPRIGPNLARAAGRVKDTVKYLVVPGVLFEELGFNYIGPVNGHDLDELTVVLNNARQMKGPVLIHTLTEKGRGYEPARQKPDVFHGVGPFDVKTGHQFKKSIKTYTEIFGNCIVEMAKNDNRIVAITAAMSGGTGLSNFASLYPQRFFDVGICEQHAVTMAAGMAKAGLKPVVCLYSTFLQRAYDQIIHDVALPKLPVVFAIDRAGLVGEDGATHQGAFDISFLRIIPNLTIMAPSNENELVDMFYTAMKQEGPVAIRYPRGVGEGTQIKEQRNMLPIGRGQVLCEGSSLVIIAIGRGVSIGREVAALAGDKGIGVTLINARFAKPLDEDLITAAAQNCGRLVTIEDNCLNGGFGSSILEFLEDKGIDADVIRAGIPDEFIEHGKVDLLFDYINMNAEAIMERIVGRWPDIVNNRTLGLLRFGKN